ncbi:MAG: bifunctional (p)ppGpp synthetase/guanosine-3',5'-bis(diphosphate) 3'-pyrophosphohydrolase [Ignavibacteriota bacterium]|jgi:RelA/SpoT family (p)ppGpp synthetase|nr:bifunctional (p)ppGpp synthetase/guanosine-3',5'-bis(diphosphate) 3'-pyrophosphohydrolase [Ignavibacteriales bacterium]MBL1121542.1 bifunctional (p)ppGpp synthetase/guanosine-3',5'-bis(diphosphate) 3'-pyrophosphohydrolase [Ignavibacteriota bacterium]MBV6419425.1 GTP pyrophosphokinase [Ignavibacteriaceae bacterium]MCE7855214.1 bifunctional (p)ppGpp synthetase/guanosine-3',5'-bis(diphosphate) 3'-pyrophosphohydrolase [Ignavibacteria bacterium CHB3]MEB2296904.1 bifunctional (p)ppGpp synthetase/g
MSKDKPDSQKMLEDLLSVCHKNLPRVDEGLITKAFKFALEAHKHDLRASGEPYFYHPYEVAMIVVEEFPLDDITVVATLLHDVVEDTDFDLNLMRKEFGEEVTEIVDGVTKISGIFKGQDITKAENYRKMLLSMVKDVRVILVKFADRLHNMRTLEFVSPDKQKRIAQETLEIYAPFAHRFGLARVKWELEDLSFKYLNRDTYEELVGKVKSTRKEREAYIKRFSDPIRKKLDEYKLKYEMGGRPKHFYSIYRKMMKRNKPFEEIYDLFALRIILDTENTNECYTTLGIVNQMYLPVPDRFKDYISIPKNNNYQSIHTTVIGPEGRLVEVQIRTKKMHEIAERGLAAHWKYKEDKTTTDKDLENWLNWIRDIFEGAGKDETRKEILEDFKLNLYQDEIYVFTPKGELRRLPIDSTPVDFAFEIHSNVGYQCIGAKINGKIVPLDTPLHSGDQIEIITSKNQHPNKNWLKFVKTQKAKSAIRKWMNKEEEKIAKTGREIWSKKLKKLKLAFSTSEVSKIARKFKFDNNSQFYQAIAQGNVNIDKVLSDTGDKVSEEQEKSLAFDQFAAIARKDAGGILVDGKSSGILYSYAKCCNPIPGDPVIGYVTIGEGVKIHRKTCSNLINLSKVDSDKLVAVDWPGNDGTMFVAGLALRGEDSPGILNEIAHTIVSYKNTNIKSININTNDSTFEGSVMVYVNNLEHLNNLIDRLKKLRGLYKAERFEGSQ